ncbi:MAG: hypothetical protein E6G32_09015 [Actinobacteria bacterium]|nr:MAG: hypothetical protein E6G32_09015 [Actinomycetota bacterium]
MPVETPSSFAQVIQDHLDLKERNSRLEPSMPLGNYKAEDPFNNHPLFKTEEQARLEETIDGEESPVAAAPTVLAWPGEDTEEHAGPDVEASLWTKSRDFDWGD